MYLNYLTILVLEEERKSKQKSNEVITKLHKDQKFSLIGEHTVGKQDSAFGIEKVYPFFNEGDPYEATKEEVLRGKWMEESKILYGDFRPTGTTKGIETVPRSKLSDIVADIKK
jgi:hypothetical protein